MSTRNMIATVAALILLALVVLLGVVIITEEEPATVPAFPVGTAVCVSGPDEWSGPACGWQVSEPADHESPYEHRTLVHRVSEEEDGPYSWYVESSRLYEDNG